MRAFIVVAGFTLVACSPSVSEGEGEGEFGGEGEGEGEFVGEGEGEFVVGEGEGEGEGEGDVVVGTWRSALYPSDWQPGYAVDGRFVHDFSWAGFNNGEDVPDDVVEPVFAVTAAADEDATAAIQAGIDAASVAGGTVLLPAGTLRIDGQLTVDASHVAIRGAGVDATRLVFTKTGLSFDAHLRFGTIPNDDDDAVLVSDAAVFDVDVSVADAAGFVVGEDVAVGHVVSDAFVDEHGMTGTWGPFNGTWQVFARRTVVAVDEERDVVTFDVPLREAALVRDGASLRHERGVISDVSLADLSLTNVVDADAARAADNNHAVAFWGVRDSFMKNVRSFAASGTEQVQSGGVLIAYSKRVTVDDVAFGQAQNRGDGGNGYLFEISQSNEILIEDSVGEKGRHNFIQNWGFGTSGCVLRRIESRGSTAVSTVFGVEVPLPASSEFHHSLATANLVEDSVIDDGFIGANRGTESSGAGHSASENVFWNLRGSGTLRSLQYGNGYVIGTAPAITVVTRLDFVSPGTSARGTAPEDSVEGAGAASTLDPPSLSQDQRARRLR